jgi:anti-anti-sigma factor
MLTRPVVQAWSQSDGAVVVEARGVLDWTSADRFRSTLYDAVDRRPGDLVVDLSRVSFMDTVAIGVLVGAFKRSQRVGVGFSVPNPHAGVLRTLTMLGLISLLRVSRSDVEPLTATA